MKNYEKKLALRELTAAIEAWSNQQYENFQSLTKEAIATLEANSEPTISANSAPLFPGPVVQTDHPGPNLPALYVAMWNDGDSEERAIVDENLRRSGEAERREQPRWFDWLWE